MADINRIVLPRYHALDVFRFAINRITAGERVVLIIMTEISGSSARPKGTPMVVTQNGDFAGYLSNGCVDSDIALHAQAALSGGGARTVRYGTGSPYMDIRLPCGGGISVRVIPDPDVEVLRRAVDDLEARRKTVLRISPELSWGAPAEGSKSVFQAYVPPLKIIAAGRGENLYFFAKAACSAGMTISLLTPDYAEVGVLRDMGVEAKSLTERGDSLSRADQWTAIVTLFHDHDCETPVLSDSLKSHAFYIGAMGSRATHAARCDTLAKEGHSPETLSRLRGPIGLVPSMRDAGRLALSVLAEIIDEERKAF